MKLALRLAFAASLLVNVGVGVAVLASVWNAGGAAERAHFGMRHQQVSERIGLDPDQLARWNAMEAGFLAALEDSGSRIRGHRERLVRELMSDRPDAATIEREAAAILALQGEQQRAVVTQLLQERELLRPGQRAALADLLLAQEPAVPAGR